MYIYSTRMFTYKRYIGPQARATSWYKNRLTSLIKNGIQNTSYNHGASKVPPSAPPSGGGGGPPRPTPDGGGGTSAGPPCPGGRRPLVIAASTAAHHMIDRHGGGNLMHCSRNSSSWIWVHMPSGTSRKTFSKRWTRSSSAPAAAGGACDGPAPGSSQRRLCAGLSSPAGPPAASSLGRRPPHDGLSCSCCIGAWNTSTSRPRGATSAQAPNKQQIDAISVYTSNICTSTSKTQKKSQTMYLCGQTPPPEAVPYLGPSGSPPPHRGIGG
jgi:hypothetical protein